MTDKNFSKIFHLSREHFCFRERKTTKNSAASDNFVLLQLNIIFTDFHRLQGVIMQFPLWLQQRLLLAEPLGTSTPCNNSSPSFHLSGGEQQMRD